MAWADAKKRIDKNRKSYWNTSRLCSARSVGWM